MPTDALTLSWPPPSLLPVTYERNPKNSQWIESRRSGGRHCRTCDSTRCYALACDRATRMTRRHTRWFPLVFLRRRLVPYRVQRHSAVTEQVLPQSRHHVARQSASPAPKESGQSRPLSGPCGREGYRRLHAGSGWTHIDVRSRTTRGRNPHSEICSDVATHIHWLQTKRAHHYLIICSSLILARL